MTSRKDKATDEQLFMQLIAMLQMAAMQQMGKLVNPMTNEIDRDLGSARASIDLLEALERKSQGNRTPAEDGFLAKVLFELRMNYVDETNRAEKVDGGGETSKEES